MATFLNTSHDPYSLYGQLAVNYAHNVSILAEINDPTEDTSSSPLSRLPLLFFPFLVIWYIAAITRTGHVASDVASKKRREPDVAPYGLPWLGHSLQLARNKFNFIVRVRDFNTDRRPLKLKFYRHTVNLISSPEHIRTIWHSSALETKPIAMMTLSTLFDSPPAAYNLWARDTAGAKLKPHPKSMTPAADRIYYHTHKSSHTYMSGTPLQCFARRFQAQYREYLNGLAWDGEWSAKTDLYSFVQTSLTTAAVAALCSPSLSAISPSFIEDFWKFDAAVPDLFYGIPRLTAPTGLRARQRCLDGIKKWHSYAEAHFDQSNVAADGHDPFWGAPLVRARQAIWKDMPAMDANGRASEDLGIIWGENTNSVPGAFWCLLHVLRDPSLLARVRAECNKSIIESTSRIPEFDADQICQNPLLQSIWSEAMRLYVAIFVTRCCENDDVYLDDEYVIGKGQLVAVDSWVRHHDRSIWNEGTAADPHSVDEFWAERFLLYPDDPNSGPLKVDNSLPKQPTDEAAQSSEPQFATAGMGSIWIPFGGGKSMCPGRRFAKVSMLLCLAMMVTNFDLDLQDAPIPEPDKRYYGLGVLPPKGATPFRVRART